MSCQQASRFITASNIIKNNTTANGNCKNLNNNNQNHNIIKGKLITREVIQQEDPYVFTESVPTTPPILFNTQKTRTRLNDLTSTCAGKLQQQKLPLTEANGKITANLNQTRAQASFLSSTTVTTTNTCTVPALKNNVTQSLTITATSVTNNNSNSKKQTNVCIVRPQLQSQQSHYHHQNFINSSTIYEGHLKSISPPPLYTPPTPSLWQTPLLLETAVPTANAKVNNVVALKPPTTTTPANIPIMGCVTPTVQTVGSTTALMNPSLTTTAMAKVAPIIVHAPLAPPPPLSPVQSPKQCLPPSKFHNHTLAQHLQKVECLKKSIKSSEADVTLSNAKVNSVVSPLKSASPLRLSNETPSNALNNSASTENHSENEDLNEIPVNVIFRVAGALQANGKSSNSSQFVKPQTEIDTLPLPQSTEAPPPSSTTTTTLKTNVNKKLSTPASKTIVTKQLIKQQQINSSSILQQQHDATKTTAYLALNSQQQTPNECDENCAKIKPSPETSTKNIPEGSTAIVANSKRTNLTHISCKTRKLNSFPSTNLNINTPYNWQINCSTTKGAVAIVKMSQNSIDLDTTHLATVTGLPYCLQHYWLNSNDIIKYTSNSLLRENTFTNPSSAREDSIAVYKQQLRRQALQLLSTRSLQKLPLKNARRRLLCVDRLLRKYQQNEQKKKELPANVKRCCVNGCDVYTLEMASHCQQHIVHNASQHVFLPCTAKFADNTQCRIPVFDITHDLPLCVEHARKRDAYNRLLYEQRPRKISTNTLLISESTTVPPKLSSVDLNNKLIPGRVSIKTQSNQHKQKQQQQNILQQFPPNINSNGNKRPALVNQQTRKRKINVGLTANPVGRPQKRVKKTAEKSCNSLTATTITKQQMPRLTSTCLKRKSSTTSLESLASNSQHSTTSNTSQQQQTQQYQQYQRHQPHQNLYGVMPTISNTSISSLAPPALAPLSSGLLGHGLPKHLFSFGHDNNHSQNPQNKTQHNRQQQSIHPININEKHSFSVSTASIATASTPTELKDFISQFSFNSQKQTQQGELSIADVNLLNTNSNSNFTSSGMGSTTSLPTADDFLTQDMLSMCENSSASSADTGLGGLSDPELMLGGPDDDIPLGDTPLLEEHDLENVLNSLPEDAFKELFTTVHQDESDEIERAIELADRHLKTLQQTIGSELGDFLDFSDDMLMDNGDLCSGSSAHTVLDTSALFTGGGTVDSNSIAVAVNGTQGGGADIRSLVQT